MTEVCVWTKHYSKNNAVTYVGGKDGIIATFPYNPSDIVSVTQRLQDFWRFSVARNIHVIEVLEGDLVAK